MAKYSVSILVCLASTLVGCAVNIPTSPDTFSIEPSGLSQLPRPQTIAVLNGYTGESKFEARMATGVSWVFDRKQMTDTAVVMLGRAMEKNGMTLSPQADKKITLRVRILRALLRSRPFVSTTKGAVALDVAFGDGTSTYVEGDNADSGLNQQVVRAFDGAVLNALNHLLTDEKFVAYMKR